ncbi:MAG: DNA primase [Magnetovibrionaceae bacterium]
MGFPPDFLEELRERVNLVDVVARRVNLQRKGREWVGLSPFQKEKTPSFYVVPEKGFYHCFSSGEHGDVIDFMMKAEGLSFPDAVERLAGEAGLPLPAQDPEAEKKAARRKTLHDVLEAACVSFQRNLSQPEGRDALHYLVNRGLSEETIKRFRLGFSLEASGALKGALKRQGYGDELMVEAGLAKRPDDGRDPYDYFRGRVMFPISDRKGRIIGFGARALGDAKPKYLNSPETPVFHKGRVLYGLDLAAPAARKSGRLVVCEGYMDVIALAHAGFGYAVAPLGTAVTEDQIASLWRLVPEPVLCLDGDKAGQKAARRAAERTLPILKSGHGLRFAYLPEGEDPDSLVQTGGPEAFGSILETALPLSEALWRMESGGQVPSEPEARAALQDRLENLAKQVGDPTLRGHLARSFKDRLWAKKPRQTAKPGRRPWGPPEKPLVAVSGTGPRVDPALSAARVLMAIAINHPHLFPDLEEDLGRVNFSDAALDALRQSLILDLSLSPGPTPAELKDRLSADGQAFALDGLFEDPLIRTHRMIGTEVDAARVLETWRANFAQVVASVGPEQDDPTERPGKVVDFDDIEEAFRRNLAKAEEEGG